MARKKRKNNVGNSNVKTSSQEEITHGKESQENEKMSFQEEMKKIEEEKRLIADARRKLEEERKLLEVIKEENKRVLEENEKLKEQRISKNKDQETTENEGHKATITEGHEATITKGHNAIITERHEATITEGHEAKITEGHEATIKKENETTNKENDIIKDYSKQQKKSTELIEDDYLMINDTNNEENDSLLMGDGGDNSEIDEDTELLLFDDGMDTEVFGKELDDSIIEVKDTSKMNLAMKDKSGLLKKTAHAPSKNEVVDSESMVTEEESHENRMHMEQIGEEIDDDLITVSSKPSKKYQGHPMLLSSIIKHIGASKNKVNSTAEADSDSDNGDYCTFDKNDMDIDLDFEVEKEEDSDSLIHELKEHKENEPDMIVYENYKNLKMPKEFEQMATQFKDPLSELAFLSSKRNPTKVVLVTDEREFTGRSQDLSSDIGVLSKPQLTYGNAFDFLKSSEYWNTGCLYIFFAGSHSLVPAIEDSECTKKKCNKPLKSHDFINWSKNSKESEIIRLKHNVVDLHRAVLLNTSHDDIIFSSVLPINYSLYNKHLAEKHKKATNHYSTNNILTNLNVEFQDLLKIVIKFNVWLKQHNKIMNYFNCSVDFKVFKIIKANGVDTVAFNRNILSDDGFSLMDVYRNSRIKHIEQMCNDVYTNLEDKKKIKPEFDKDLENIYNFKSVKSYKNPIFLCNFSKDLVFEGSHNIKQVLHDTNLDNLNSSPDIIFWIVDYSKLFTFKSYKSCTSCKFPIQILNSICQTYEEFLKSNDIDAFIQNVVDNLKTKITSHKDSKRIVIVPPKPLNFINFDEESVTHLEMHKQYYPDVYFVPQNIYPIVIKLYDRYMNAIKVLSVESFNSVNFNSLLLHQSYIESKPNEQNLEQELSSKHWIENLNSLLYLSKTGVPDINVSNDLLFQLSWNTSSAIELKKIIQVFELLEDFVGIKAEKNNSPKVCKGTVSYRTEKSSYFCKKLIHKQIFSNVCIELETMYKSTMHFTEDNDVLEIKEAIKQLKRKQNMKPLSERVIKGSFVSNNAFWRKQKLKYKNDFNLSKDEVEEAINEYKKENEKYWLNELNKDADLYVYKIEMCDDSYCSEFCIGYHDKKDQRRDPRKIKYKDIDCFLNSTKCDENCRFSHNNYEMNFHPTNFKRKLCTGICSRKRICPNYHPGTPDSFYTPNWQNIFSNQPGNTIRYLVGAIRNLFMIKTLPGLCGLVLVPYETLVYQLIACINPIANNHKINVQSIVNEDDTPIGAHIIIGTPYSIAKLFNKCGIKHLRGLLAFIIDGFDEMITLHKNSLVKIITDVLSTEVKSRTNPNGINKVISVASSSTALVKYAEFYFKTKFNQVLENSGFEDEIDLDMDSDRNDSVDEYSIVNNSPPRDLRENLYNNRSKPSLADKHERSLSNLIHNVNKNRSQSFQSDKPSLSNLIQNLKKEKKPEMDLRNIIDTIRDPEPPKRTAPGITDFRLDNRRPPSPFQDDYHERISDTYHHRKTTNDPSRPSILNLVSSELDRTGKHSPPSDLRETFYQKQRSKPSLSDKQETSLSSLLQSLNKNKSQTSLPDRPSLSNVIQNRKSEDSMPSSSLHPFDVFNYSSNAEIIRRSPSPFQDDYHERIPDYYNNRKSISDPPRQSILNLVSSELDRDEFRGNPNSRVEYNNKRSYPRIPEPPSISRKDVGNIQSGFEDNRIMDRLDRGNGPDWSGYIDYKMEDTRLSSTRYPPTQRVTGAADYYTPTDQRYPDSEYCSIPEKRFKRDKFYY